MLNPGELHISEAAATSLHRHSCSYTFTDNETWKSIPWRCINPCVRASLFKIDATAGPKQTVAVYL